MSQNLLGTVECQLPPKLSLQPVDEMERTPSQQRFGSVGGQGGEGKVRIDRELEVWFKAGPSLEAGRSLD